MTSSNEPGTPKKNDDFNGDGSVDRGGAHRGASAPAGRMQEGKDSPPWQWGGGRGPQGAPRQNDPPTEVRAPNPPGGIEGRLNRFVTGGGEGPSGEAYASELPDLSGPTPRSPQRKTAPDRNPETPNISGPGRSTAPENRESREPRETHVQVSRRPRGPVRASMQIRRIDPWSTLKVSLVLSVALFFVWMIAVAFLYLVLGGMGVWSKLNSNVGDLLNNASGSNAELVSSGTIFGGAFLIGLVNIVLLTAMATIGAFVYNLTTDLIGGIEVTLADRD